MALLYTVLVGGRGPHGRRFGGNFAESVGAVGVCLAHGVDVFVSVWLLLIVDAGVILNLADKSLRLAS